MIVPVRNPWLPLVLEFVAFEDLAIPCKMKPVKSEVGADHTKSWLDLASPA